MHVACAMTLASYIVNAMFVVLQAHNKESYVPIHIMATGLHHLWSLEFFHKLCSKMPIFIPNEDTGTNIFTLI
jgi:hypothetical protein